jgi:S1-C subfamily serine protease
MSPVGTQSTRFLTPQLSDAYIPLYGIGGIGVRYAAAVAIAPNIAVTNDHNANIVAENLVLGRSRDYDLLFFRTDRRAVPIAHPKVGERVIAYGQYGKKRRREAAGVIRDIEMFLPSRCPDCPAQKTIAYDAEAGRGFSGGPVVDAASGEVLRITASSTKERRERWARMRAHDMDLVIAEMHAARRPRTIRTRNLKPVIVVRPLHKRT